MRSNTVTIHEKLCRWIEEAYLPQQPTERITVLTRSACCNLTALAHVTPRFAVGEGFVYAGYESYPCETIPTFITYLEDKPAYRTGALLFKFEKEDGTGFEVLVASDWIDDDNVGIDMMGMACLPPEYADRWLEFEEECSRISRSAIAYKDKVYIVGGKDVTFDAMVKWEDVHLPAELKTTILKDIDSFFEKGVAIYQRLNINPFRKLLLAGVPGTGKTMLCSAIARLSQTKGRFIVYVSGSNRHGAQFWKIHQALDMAASSDMPTIVIVEELDSYLDEDSKAQLLNVLDGSETPNNPCGTVLIATTNHPEIIDDRVLKRPGRVDRIFIIPELSDEEDVERMLSAYLGDQWREEHQTIVPRLLGKPGAFVREVALYALTIAAYQDMDGLPLSLLEESLDTLTRQIEAKDGFLTAHKRAPIGLGPANRRGNGRL
ncbi:MAG: ATP-binding protein [Anaerolineae bacterium]|nr:ATP-binding protein [Anaerolineae bacterium]